jgi:ketosteroid isomerase-like protein
MENLMTSRGQIENAIRSLYSARVNGDLEGTLRDLADDFVFRFNGRGTGVELLSSPSRGKAAFRPVLRELIKHWRFEDWKECSLLVDGEKALLHWTAHVTYTPTNKSEQIDTLDVVTFRNGQIVDFLQCTDTALVMSLTLGAT